MPFVNARERGLAGGCGGGSVRVSDRDRGDRRDLDALNCSFGGFSPRLRPGLSTWKPRKAVKPRSAWRNSTTEAGNSGFDGGGLSLLAAWFGRGAIAGNVTKPGPQSLLTALGPLSPDKSTSDDPRGVQGALGAVFASSFGGASGSSPHARVRRAGLHRRPHRATPA